MNDLPTDESSESGGAKFVDFADTEPVDTPRDRVVRETPHLILWLILLPLGFTFFLTCLFLAMRGVMDLGGMVATGGPYEIAHPAPGWVWIVPVSIIGFMILIFVSFIPVLSKDGGNVVAAFFWPAVFLSLAWNFLEYGIVKTIIWSHSSIDLLIISRRANIISLKARFKPSKSSPSSTSISTSRLPCMTSSATVER